jgi:hypothetical protein
MEIPCKNGDEDNCPEADGNVAGEKQKSRSQHYTFAFIEVK